MFIDLQFEMSVNLKGIFSWNSIAPKKDEILGKILPYCFWDLLTFKSLDWVLYTYLRNAFFIAFSVEKKIKNKATCNRLLYWFVAPFYKYHISLICTWGNLLNVWFQKFENLISFPFLCTDFVKKEENYRGSIFKGRILIKEIRYLM